MDSGAHQEVIELRRENEYLRKKVGVLEEELALIKKKLFGSRSEKKEAEGPTLFDDVETIAASNSVSETVTVKKHTKKKGGRKPLSDKLPREERVIDFSKEECSCGHCGNAMTRIDEDVSERAELIPPKVYVEKCIRPRYVCRQCDTTPVAQQLPYVLPRSIAGNALFAYIITSKFCDSLPFHRQEGILSRYGIEYPKANMCNNAMQFYETYGEKMAALLEKQLFKGPLLQLDETGKQVLGEENRPNTANSFVWIFLGGGEKKAAVFCYRETRKADFLRDFVGNYKGVVLTDGYPGYDKVFQELPLTHAGCNAHARRYFVEALEAGHEQAETAVNLYGQLYQVERLARENNDSPAQTFELRQKHSKPLMRELRNHCESILAKAKSKNALFKAANYAISGWPKLTQFLADPQIPIDNNANENAIRPFALGRKNWYFSASPRGAEASCFYYSLVQTAKINGHEPFHYLRYLFNQLPYIANDSDLEKLMPYELTPPILDSS